MAKQKNISKRYNKPEPKTSNKKVQKQQIIQESITNQSGLTHISSKYIIVGLLAVLLITTIVHLPSFNNQLTNWDDDKYVNNLPVKKLDAEGIKTLFTTSKYYMGNYHPLTMVTLVFDYSHSKVKPGTDKVPVDEVNPFWFHLTNLILHLASSALLFFFFLKLMKHLNFRFAFQSALLCSVLFGVHTLHVESIVWVSERKDVLYTFFFIASLLAYVQYLTNKKIGFIFLSFLLFVLSLFSKGQATSLSITLIALDYVWGRKLLNIRLILEKFPFIAGSVIFGIIAIIAQKEGQAIHSIAEYSYFERIIIACYGLVNYLWKLIIPLYLSAIYPYEYISGFFPVRYYFFLLVIPAIILISIYAIKKSKVIVFGLAFFLINIALLLQLIPVGSAIIADRYAYVPSIGIFFIVCYFFNKLLEKSSTYKIPLYLGFSAYLIILSILTVSRTQVWKNSVTLWTDVINKYPIAVVAYNNRGSAKKLIDESDGAIADFSEAIRIKPDYKHAIYNRGTAFKDKGMLKEALADFDLALLLDPNFTEAYHNRGITRDNLNNLQGAIEDYSRAILLSSSDVKPYVNRGVAKGKSGDFKGAIEDFNQALQFEPANADAISNRGLAKHHMDLTNEAIKDFDLAIKIRPDFIDAYFNRAIAKSKLDPEGAINDYSTVLTYKPNLSTALVSRAMLYYKLKMNKEACLDLQNASKLGDKQAQERLAMICK